LHLIISTSYNDNDMYRRFIAGGSGGAEVRMSEAVVDQATAFVEPLGKPNSGKATVPVRRLRWGRIVKIGGVGGLLAAVAAALLIQQSQVTTDNAVVSAYVRSIRSPIQGQVSGLHLHIGDEVTGTSLLAHVANDRVSDEHLVDLRGELARTKADRAALEDQHNTLTALRATLVARSDVYNKAQTAYAGAVSNEAAAQLAAGSFHLAGKDLSVPCRSGIGCVEPLMADRSANPGQYAKADAGIRRF
jgi:multidrug efflux pump subunit AcrA (membrane-fusion protein)